jgi:hypothetical protein
MLLLLLLVLLLLLLPGTWLPLRLVKRLQALRAR